MVIPLRTPAREVRLDALNLRVAIEERGYLVFTRPIQGHFEAVGYCCTDYLADQVCFGSSEIDALRSLWSAVSGSSEQPRNDR